MAFELGAVVAHIQADTKNFQDGITKAKSSLSSFGDGVGAVAGAIGKATLILGGLGIAGGVAMKLFADQAGEAEKTVIRANALLAASTKDNVKQFKEFEQAVSDTSQAFIEFGFDDEETRLAMAKSLAVTKDVTESKKEMALAADFARLQDIGITEAQKLLQMAYMGNARVLKQYGIELEDGATKTEIFGKIQDLAGGQAMAFSDSYAGSVARFTVEFDNLKEKIGEVVLPIFSQLFEIVRNFIYQLNNADFTWFTVSMDTAIAVSEQFYETVQTVVSGVIQWFNENLMPFILMLQAFMAEHWEEIRANVEMVWNFIVELVKVVVELLTVIFTGFYTWLSTFVKNNWDEIKITIQSALQIISGALEVFFGLVIGIFKFALAILKGDWKGAWQAIVDTSNHFWGGLQKIFDGAFGFIKAWGGKILEELVRPFVDAWNRIQDYVRKIRDALDFTKKHSPSVVDIVTKGVKEVNRALDKLDLGVNVSPHAAVAGVSPGSSIAQTTIKIDMNGAVINDGISAFRMGEKFGDGIIRKLQQNVRF